MTIVSTQYTCWLADLRKQRPDIGDLLQRHPVQFDQIERSILPLDVGMLSEHKAKSPLELAGLKVDQVSVVLQSIHDEFLVAEFKYKTMLNDDVSRDLLTIKHYGENFKIKEKYGPFWRIGKLFGRSFISKKKLSLHAQYGRHSWFVKVGALEQARLDSAKEKILEEFEYKKLEGSSVEVEQLEKVYKALFEKKLMAGQKIVK